MSVCTVCQKSTGDDYEDEDDRLIEITVHRICITAISNNELYNSNNTNNTKI